MRTSSNKILLFILVFLFFPLITSVAFANTNDLINQQMQHRDLVLKKNQGSFTSLKKTSDQKILNYQPLINEIKKAQPADLPISSIKKETRKEIKKVPQAIVFVSLSMPKLTLEKTLTQANQYQIPVVIRGLYKNSFKKTAIKIFDLVKEKNQGGVLIDPVWFRKFKIKTVPALVVQTADGKDFDLVYGNVPIQKALTIIAEQGAAKDVAQEILRQET